MATCDSWLNSGGNSPARWLPGQRVGDVEAVGVVLGAGQEMLRKASTVRIRSVTALVADQCLGWCGWLWCRLRQWVWWVVGCAVGV